MSTADDFRDKAEECRQQAEKAIGPKVKRFGFALAKSWLKLAQEITSTAQAQTVRAPMPPDRTERLSVFLPSDELAAIDDFKLRNRIPTRAAAARELLRRGLALADKD